MCINIVEIWFGIATWQVLSIFDRVICLPHDSDGVLLFHVFISYILSPLQTDYKKRNVKSFSCY